MIVLRPSLFRKRKMNVERISAVTLKVREMARSVHFYNEILGLEIIYGGKNASFTSLRMAGAQDAILNLEQGTFRDGWGRVIFHVRDVDSSGLTSKQNNSIPRAREMPPGANDISICTIQTATNYRLQNL